MICSILALWDPSGGPLYGGPIISLIKTSLRLPKVPEGLLLWDPLTWGPLRASIIVFFLQVGVLGWLYADCSAEA